MSGLVAKLHQLRDELEEALSVTCTPDAWCYVCSYDNAASVALEVNAWSSAMGLPEVACEGTPLGHVGGLPVIARWDCPPGANVFLVRQQSLADCPDAVGRCRQ